MVTQQVLVKGRQSLPPAAAHILAMNTSDLQWLQVEHGNQRIKAVLERCRPDLGLPTHLVLEWGKAAKLGILLDEKALMRKAMEYFGASAEKLRQFDIQDEWNE